MRPIALLFLFLPLLAAAQIQTTPNLRSAAGQYGYQNERQQWVIQPRYARLESPWSRFLVAESATTHLKGVLGPQGDTLIPLEYEALRKPEGNAFPALLPYFLVLKDARWGLLDTAGRTVVPLEWDYADFVNDSTVFFSRTGQQVTVNRQGKTVFVGDFERTELLSTNFGRFHQIRAVRNGKMGLVDLSGKVLVPFDFQHIDYTGYGNFVRARLLDGRQGIYNFQGREVLKPVYRNLLFYAPALFAAQDFDTGKSGMLDTLGRVVLPLEYAACRVVGREGPFLKARQKEADSWALFGPDGQRLTEPTYLEFEYYQNAPDLIFGQQKDRKWVLLNRQGQVQPEAPFDDYSVHSASFVLRQGDLRAFLNLTGQRVTPYKYTLAKGFTSLKEARQLGKELNVSAPDSLLGSASLNGQQVYVDSRGRELTRSDTAQYERLSDEQQASFPGGESALIKYLESHLRYPPEAAKNSIQGRAVLSFKIEADGSLSEIKVLRDPGGGCGAEAVRLVQSMPKWVPASVGGKAVATRFTLPVTFRLNH